MRISTALNKIASSDWFIEFTNRYANKVLRSNSYQIKIIFPPANKFVVAEEYMVSDVLGESDSGVKALFKISIDEYMNKYDYEVIDENSDGKYFHQISKNEFDSVLLSEVYRYLSLKEGLDKAEVLLPTVVKQIKQTIKQVTNEPIQIQIFRGSEFLLIQITNSKGSKYVIPIIDIDYHTVLGEDGLPEHDLSKIKTELVKFFGVNK